MEQKFILKIYLEAEKNEVNGTSWIWGPSSTEYYSGLQNSGAIEIFLAYRGYRASRYTRAQKLENYSTISGFGSEVFLALASFHSIFVCLHSRRDRSFSCLFAFSTLCYSPEFT